MKTSHRIYFQNAAHMRPIDDRSVDLVVTSPPYPMIAMWDEVFCAQDAAIGRLLKGGDGMAAFERMHRRLDRVWDELRRVVKPGGIVCINIGDATRTLKENFRLYPNHARTLQYLQQQGFHALPDILWRKQTNAPNKFMGSGMLPAGAYVTLEHEYILVLRKGGKRVFQTAAQKQNRRESAFFWEERNAWFSDVWFDLKGSRQALGRPEVRTRSGAFPFELAYRLICMYSVKGDLVLDPFAGTGTTLAAAMAGARNSVGFEIDPGLAGEATALLSATGDFANARIHARLARHMDFCTARAQAAKPFKHTNVHYGFPVITAQEKQLLLNDLQTVVACGSNAFEATYALAPQARFCQSGDAPGPQAVSAHAPVPGPCSPRLSEPRGTSTCQMPLFSEPAKSALAVRPPAEAGDHHSAKP